MSFSNPRSDHARPSEADSLLDNIKRLFTTNQGTNIYCPFLGVRAKQEIAHLLEEEPETLESELQRMFQIYEPRVRNVYFSDWRTEKETDALFCRVTMVHKESDREYVYGISFRDNVRENGVVAEI
ncbi:MAG: hypothetical protein ACLFVQ_13955 [Chitinispirillaceae bacterium]